MALKALAAGLAKYARHLAMVVLVPLAWAAAWRVAGRHADRDPRGRAKVAVGIVAGAVLAAGGFLFLVEFRADSVDGMYDTMVDRVARAVGEAEYQEQVGVAEAKTKALGELEVKLAEARAAGNESAAANFEAARDRTQGEMNNATLRVVALRPHHDLYLAVNASLQERDDERARELILAFPDSHYKAPSLEAHGILEDSGAAFALKDDAVADMDRILWAFGYPSLVGFLYAPLVFALGSILRNAFDESDTVGFKPYPGASMGFFLLLGGFGVPATFLAAWTLMDVRLRSAEGQIAL